MICLVLCSLSGFYSFIHPSIHPSLPPCLVFPIGSSRLSSMASSSLSAASPSLGLRLASSPRRSPSPSRSLYASASAFHSLCSSGSGLLLHIHRSPPVRCFAAESSSSSSSLTPELKSTLDRVVQSHKVVLFMKGSRELPQCGFSATVVGILTSLNVPFETLDILQNDTLRQALKDYSAWPTFPQLYIDGQFFGGCDITLEAYKSGELEEVLERAMCS